MVGRFGCTPKARDTAVREAVALRRVQHPNVVRFREAMVTTAGFGVGFGVGGVVEEPVVGLYRCGLVRVGWLVEVFFDWKKSG